MKRLNIPALIVLSFLAVLLLLMIQWYLVSTTFKYQNRQFEDEMAVAISEILEPYNPTDERLDSLFRLTDTLAKKYKNRDKFTGQAFIKAVLKGMEGQNLYGEWLRQELPGKGFSRDFKHAAILTFLGLNENGKPLNTFLFDTLMIAHNISGDLQSLDHAFEVHRFSQSREDYLIGLSLLMDVPEQRRIVFRRMWGLLALAAASIFAVVGIFLYSIRALIRQKRLSDLKSDFINNITHEFKTPLATINLASQNLRMPKIQKQPESMGRLVDVIQRQNTRLQLLLDQVMETGLASESPVLNKEKVLIHEFLANRVRDFKIKLDDPEANVTTRFDRKETELSIDPFHMTTMLYNLLDNAVKYARDKPWIEIRTEVRNGQFLLEIEDQGIGMDLKKRGDIFDKFYRIPTGNLHNVKGLGLGLFYVKQTVEAHGGRIEVKSKVGEGTVFSIFLPKE